MCNEEILSLSEKIYKTTCEIEYLYDLKKYLDDKIEIENNVEEKEVEKTKTINFKKAI